MLVRWNCCQADRMKPSCFSAGTRFRRFVVWVGQGIFCHGHVWAERGKAFCFSSLCLLQHAQNSLSRPRLAQLQSSGSLQRKPGRRTSLGHDELAPEPSHIRRRSADVNERSAKSCPQSHKIIIVIIIISVPPNQANSSGCWAPFNNA